MRIKFPSPSLDWFLLAIHWLVLLGLGCALLLGSLAESAASLILISWLLVLLPGTCLKFLGRPLKGLVVLLLAADLLLAGASIFLQAGFASLPGWIGLVLLLSTTLGLGLLPGLLAAVLLILMFLGSASLYSSPYSAVGLVAVPLGMAAAGLLFGLLARKLSRCLPAVDQADGEKTGSLVTAGRLRALYELTTSLSGNLNFRRVLDSILDLSMTAISPDETNRPDDRLVSAALLFTGDGRLEVGAARRFTPADMRLTLPAASPLFERMVAEGQPVMVEAIDQDPELARVIAFHDCACVYCYPLRSGLNAYGVLLFGHPDRAFFSPSRLELLDILGRQAAIAVKNTRLYQDLVAERDRMIEVQEESRHKLARDLHDGPTQSVAAMAMRINLARRMMEKNPLAASEEMIKIEDLARRTTKEIRHMLFTLRPLALESQGLTSALQAMADKMKETFDQQVEISIDEPLLEHIDIGKQGVIFFIIEEAVNNARKHARAEVIHVRLRTLENDLALVEIQDDGIGFDVTAVQKGYEQRGSLGMINLQERSELIGGVLHIESSPGRGTLIQVVVPLTEEASGRLHHA